MKMYQTTSFHERNYCEFCSSATDASKIRTRLKKLDHHNIVTEEVDVPAKRTDLIRFLNDLTAHPTWVVRVVATKLAA